MLLPGFDTRTFQPVTNHYTNCDSSSPIFRFNDPEISYETAWEVTRDLGYANRVCAVCFTRCVQTFEPAPDRIMRCRRDTELPFTFRCELRRQLITDSSESIYHWSVNIFLRMTSLICTFYVYIMHCCFCRYALTFSALKI